MHFTIHVSGASGDTANLLMILFEAHAVHALVNNGRELSFVIRPPDSMTPELQGLWAGRVVTAVARTPNVTCELHHD